MNGNTPPGVWAGQTIQVVGLALLLILVWIAWGVLGRPYPMVYWIAVFIPVVHQVFVWITWRLELLKSSVSSTIGFRGYLAGFFVLFGGRFLSLLLLACIDRGSLGLNFTVRVIFTCMLAVTGLYAMYSVRRYFGMARAAGADHFLPQYREMALVKEGIFRFTENGMYIYAFLLFWAIAIGFDSSAALVVAAFSHAYIWVHFYATERPDMKYLYAPKQKQ